MSRCIFSWKLYELVPDLLCSFYFLFLCHDNQQYFRWRMLCQPGDVEQSCKHLRPAELGKKINFAIINHRDLGCISHSSITYTLWLMYFLLKQIKNKWRVKLIVWEIKYLRRDFLDIQTYIIGQKFGVDCKNQLLN